MGGRLGSPRILFPGFDSTPTRPAWRRPARRTSWQAHVLRAEAMAAAATLWTEMAWSYQAEFTSDRGRQVCASMSAFSSCGATWQSKCPWLPLLLASTTSSCTLTLRRVSPTHCRETLRCCCLWKHVVQKRNDVSGAAAEELRRRNAPGSERQWHVSK